MRGFDSPALAMRGEIQLSEGRLGLGAMIRLMPAVRSVEAWSRAKGKVIKDLKLDPEGNHGDGALVFTFEDGTRVALIDAGRSCCEERYLHTDDDLSAFIGSKLLGATSTEVEETDPVHGDAVHESSFTSVQTSEGIFTVVTHNEHNGYYGGIVIMALELEPIET
jgi:hypothetical protein